MPIATLADAAAALNRIKRWAGAGAGLLKVLRAGALGAVTVSLWSLVQPQEQLTQLALGGLVAALAMVSSLGRSRDQRVGAGDLALALEMRHGAGQSQPLPSGAPGLPVPPQWAPLLAAEVGELRAYEGRRLLALASTLALPVAVSFLTLPSAAPSFKLAFSEVTNAVSRLSRGANLRVIQGAATDVGDKAWPLTAKEPMTLELLAQNLVEVEVTGGGFKHAAPVVELRRRDGDGAGTPKAAVYQSFQMLPERDAGRQEDEDASRHAISFDVPTDVDLYIPAIDQEHPLAHVKVRQLPIPKVTLTVASELEDPWPDDQPLNLRIQVKAEKPLQTVRLLIKSGQRQSKELVANVMTEDKLEITTDYRLVLEQYVESDLAEVEIVAEAVDRSLPAPLTGHSDPIRLNTASAYGRYRASLETLRELKTLVDEAVSKQEKSLPKAAKTAAAKAADQSEKSPFFDGLDRVQIHRFSGRVDELEAEPSTEKLMEMSTALNDFLFEHEILDDRERDRDFFVAARALSRLVEQEVSRRPVDLKTVTARMQKFLDDRQERWTKRVDRLSPRYKPEEWPTIRDKRPFHAALAQVEKLDNQAQKNPAAHNEQLTLLSQAVTDYRTWIETLEAREDKMREEEEQSRQEGLASAKDTLRELQKRQAEVSADIDRADERPKEQLEAQWPATRMKENANAKETHRLENQMRSLAPSAGNRLQAAYQAMEQATEAGNGSNYTVAESNADLAGRLLRQAESAAQQSQQKRRSRGRRRRVTGDNYYGQSVVGGDVEIKREYQVDRRYREDILDEVQSSNYDDDNRTLMETYLRQIVR